MVKAEMLYYELCKELGVDSLSDEDIARVGSILEVCLGEFGELTDVALGETFDINAQLV